MPNLTLSVRCDDTKWGEQVAVIGSWNSWDKNNISPLTTTPDQFPQWTAHISLPDTTAKTLVEYKYVIIADGHIRRWEADGTRNNRVILPSVSSVSDTFGQLPRVRSSKTAKRQEPAHHKWELPHAEESPIVNEEHLSSLDGLEKAIVKATVEHRSWRQRLAFVRSLFTDEGVANAAQFDKCSLQHLVSVSIYLTFLASGQLRCGEDGGHHRPNHHANEAQLIEKALANIMQIVVSTEGTGMLTASASYIPYVIRKIYPQLPSYSAQFTVSVPLTRIRDIAHRSDIPHDFKQEIKHTLQNKLHRCAGPEDLKTSERLLERINNGDFSQDFKEQFQIFHEELRAFFNASSLDERLRYLEHNQINSTVAELAISLLSLKNGWREAFIQLDTLTRLRQSIANLDFMRDGSTKDAEFPGEDMQKTRLADIDLESYAFVLLASLARDVEAESSSRIFQWPFALSGFSRAFENMCLSSIRPTEANAIASELSLVSREHKRSNSTPHRSLLLRTKAALDRALRFMHKFCTEISDVYSTRVVSLGKALNIDQHSIAVFAEAEIRSHVAFQASRIADTCAKVCRRSLSLPPWDPLFVGESIGKLLFVENLTEIPRGEKEPTIAVCRHANGEEDIPSQVCGIVLGRPLPHLSHLGVRARQAGVVFVCAEEQNAFKAVWERRNMSNVKLVVTSTEGLAILTEVHEQVHPHAVGDKAEEVDKQPLAVQIAFDGSTKVPIGIEQATKGATSSKSAFAGELRRLSLKSDGLFEVPNGVVLPHGIFQTQCTKHAKRYKELVCSYSNVQAGTGETNITARTLHDFVRINFQVEDKTCRMVQKWFQTGMKVMVRSSANAEDLEEMSGAGLYDSVANVDVHSTKGLQDAITHVWASLWTERAASSRTSYGVPHERVSMAVLIQEMVYADASFVAFSKDPVTKQEDIYIEMAIGMGETLASATSEGSPYRFRVARESGEVKTVSFASYSEALAPRELGLGKVVVDYSKELLTANAGFRIGVVQNIARSVQFVEKEFGGAQDIEGAITVENDSTKVFVVQARPQIL